MIKDIKKQITKDWNSVFPDMGVYKDLWLMKRIGPILIGISIEMTSGKDRYKIISHIHNLCNSFPTISYTLHQRVEGLRGGDLIIPILVHEERYKHAAMKLECASILKFRADMWFSEIISAYNTYIRIEEKLGHVTRFHPRHFEDILLLNSWAGKNLDETKALLNNYKQIMSLWPARSLARLGEYGLKGWYDKMETIINDRNKIIKTVEEELVNHKLQKIPYKDLFID
jgi:hypothetical protein